jgi:alcohol dehydrogenase class IV
VSTYELGAVPRVVAGHGSLDGLGSIVDGLGGRSTLVVLDSALASMPLGARLSAALAGVQTVTHVVPPGEPTVDAVDAAAAVARGMDGVVIVGVGGGSALDIAKQAAVVSAGAASIRAHLLAATAFAGRRPIVAVPTTSGTGAEATRTCIVSDERGRKLWTWGDEMLPDVVVLDPAATVTMPPHVTAATGLDAFVHAVEAATGQRRNPVSTAAASQAVRLVVTHLGRAVRDGGDLDARMGMQEAAFLAGMAIDNCGTGIAHSIGHALGSLYHVPHGAAVAMGLDAAIEWNVAGAPEAFCSVSDAVGRPATDLPDVLRDLFDDSRFADAVDRLPDVDLDADDVARMMAADENLPMLRNNCVVPDDMERLDLASRMVAGWRLMRTGR